MGPICKAEQGCLEHLITQRGLVLGRAGAARHLEGRGFQIRAEDLGGQQSIYAAQAKPILRDRGLGVADFLCRRLNVGIIRGTAGMASIGRGEITVWSDPRVPR